MGRIYSSLKMFRFTDRLSIIEKGGVPFPVHVRIKPTNICNHRCWFCAYRNDDLELGSSMRIKDSIPLPKMMEIVDDLGEMGVKAVTLSGGGEPLIYPHIRELITKLKIRKIKLGILSNGSLLREDLAELIADSASWIRISMDSWDDRSYSQSRKVRSGSFSEVISNIREFNRRFASGSSNCHLSVSYLIDRSSVGQIYSICSIMKEIGVRNLKLSPVIVDMNSDKQNAYHDTIQKQVDFEVSRIESELIDSNFSVTNHYHRQNETFRKSYRSCNFAKLMTIIGADQKVYSCQDKAYTDSGLLGSIENRRFKEVWTSNDLRSRVLGIDPSSRCIHHCVAHGKNLLLDEYMGCKEDHVDFV